MIGCWENTVWAGATQGISVFRGIALTEHEEGVVWIAAVPGRGKTLEIFAVADTPAAALEAFNAAFHSPTGQVMALPEAAQVTQVRVGRRVLWRST